MGFSNWADIHEFLDEKMHFGHHHEYTVDDLKFVFKNAGFDLCEFVLHERNLREVKLSTMRQLGTQNRSRTQSRREPLLLSIAKYFSFSLICFRECAAVCYDCCAKTDALDFERNPWAINLCAVAL